jgi:hypothetical protein
VKFVIIVLQSVPSTISKALLMTVIKEIFNSPSLIPSLERSAALWGIPTKSCQGKEYVRVLEGLEILIHWHLFCVGKLPEKTQGRSRDSNPAPPECKAAP